MPEREDNADVRPIVWSGIALLATVIAVVAGVFGWRAVSGFDDLVNPQVIVAPSVPVLQTKPVEDRLAYQRQQQRQLDSYAWVDRSQQVARIPVERAMQLLSERAQ